MTLTFLEDSNILTIDRQCLDLMRRFQRSDPPVDVHPLSREGLDWQRAGGNTLSSDVRCRGQGLDVGISDGLAKDCDFGVCVLGLELEPEKVDA